MSSLRIIGATVAVMLVSSPLILGQDSGQMSGELKAQAGNSSPSPLGPPVAPVASAPWRPSALDLTVRYESGKLTVAAHGATLHRVLEVISQRTGTAIESAPGFGAGQVYVELGPATVQEVLTDLLNGSPANYLMVGSRSNPGFVERLIILARSQVPSGASQSPVVAAAPPVPTPKLYGGGGFTTDPDGSNAAVAATSGTVQEEQPPPTPNTALAPIKQIDPSFVKYQEAAAAMAKSGKSQAEILDELQKQQIQDLEAQFAPSTSH
jgi:hypothetical protein